MKNRIKKILLIVLILFLFIPKVHAKVSCSYVSEVINEYYEVVDELEELDCTNASSDSSVAAECNSKNTRKAVLLAKIFRYNDDFENCNKAELTNIVKDNKDECHSLLGDDFYDFRKTVMGAFYILAPFFLLIFGSLDFFKIVVESDMKKVKQHRTNFIKRLIALILLYLSPVAVNFALNLNLSNYNLDGNVYACNTPISYSIKTWNSVYVPPVTPTSSSGSSSGSSNGNSNLGLGRNNGLFNIRTTSPSSDSVYPSEYYDTSESNAYECVWYAKSRAIEALSGSSDKEKDKKIEKLRVSYGHGWMWYHFAVRGEETAIGNSESDGSLDSLVDFQHSDDRNSPRAGSLVSWKWSSVGCSTYWARHGSNSGCTANNPEYGHVAFVEDVDIENNKVMISEGWNNGGYLGFSCDWYTFDEMEEKGGRYDFQGYVYLFDPLEN